MAQNNRKLVDQSQALDDFFESLMRDVEAYEENEQQQQAETTVEKNTVPAVENKPEPTSQPDEIVKPTTVSEQKIETTEIVPEPVVAEPIPEFVVPTDVEEKEDSRNLFEVLPPVAPPAQEIAQDVVEQNEVVEAETESIADAEPEAVPDEEPAAIGKPEWAESDFQVMLFKVAGLSLAVPLVELNGIVECDLSEVTAMPGHADFYLGLMNHLDKTVPLVDTARFVLPPDKLTALAGDNPQERITRVVMINDCQYGLACDEVNEVVTLSPDDVRWRTQRTRRRWLAGTVVEHMCALIDANAFAELLATQTSIQEFRE